MMESCSANKEGEKILAAFPIPGRRFTCAVGQRPTPVTVLLANSGAVADEAPAPFAGVVDHSFIGEHVSS